MKAQIQGNVVVAVHPAPETAFHPDLASQFIEVPDAHKSEVAIGWLVDGDGWSAPEVQSVEEPEPESPTFRTTVSRVEFKQLFTISEHVRVKMARNYVGEEMDKVILKYTLDAAYDMLDDPQLETLDLATPIVTQFIGGLVVAGILTDERAAAIAAGVSV